LDALSNDLLSDSLVLFCPAFWSWDMSMYLDF
jgi:hypothetical protein